MARCPSRRRNCKKLARAVEHILREREHKNPYDIDRHNDRCLGNFGSLDYYEWDEDKQAFVMSSQEEIVVETECRACNFMWTLYSHWMQRNADRETGEPADPRYIDQAFQALAYEFYFTKYNPPPEQVSVIEGQWVTIVRSEIALMEEQSNHVLWLESQTKSKG